MWILENVWTNSLSHFIFFQEPLSENARIDNVISNNSYRIFQQLFKTALDILTAFRSDQQVKGIQAGTRSEQLLNQGFAHEPGTSSDEHRSAVVEIHHLARSGQIPVLAREIVVVVGHLALNLTTLRPSHSSNWALRGIVTFRLAVKPFARLGRSYTWRIRYDCGRKKWTLRISVSSKVF